MSIQSEIDRLATIKANLKIAINGPSGATVGDVFGDYPGAIVSGKMSIASAITEKGVETAADATFQQMATNILAIQSSTSINPVEGQITTSSRSNSIAIPGDLDAESIKCISLSISTQLDSQEMLDVISFTLVKSESEITALATIFASNLHYRIETNIFGPDIVEINGNIITIFPRFSFPAGIYKYIAF